MNKHHLGLVIYQTGQPQVKIMDDDFNRSTMFAVGITPVSLPARILAHEYLLDIDMGLNRNLFRTGRTGAPKSDWFNPRVDYFEKIVVCIYIGVQDSLVRDPLSTDHAVTDLFFTLWNLLKMVGAQPRTLEIKFYNEQGRIVRPYNDVYMAMPSMRALETTQDTVEVMALLRHTNESVFRGINGNYHAANYRFVFDIPHTTMKTLLLFTDGDHLKLHQLLHNMVAERFMHTRLKVVIELKTHHVHATPTEDIPMRAHTQPKISPEKSVNLIVWNSDLVYRAAAQIANMRYNEITLKDSPALDWNQVVGRMVMQLTQELGNIITALHSENLAGGIVFVPHSFNQKLKDMMSHAFGYMGLVFEEMPMNTEQLSIIKNRHHVTTLLQVYYCNNGIQPPSYAGYSPAGLFDPRTYGPPPLQPFAYDPRNPVMPPFVPPHMHSPVHMNPRSPDFGGRRPSRGSADQPEYSNRMQPLHPHEWPADGLPPHTTTGPVPDGTTIVGRVPGDDQPVQFGRTNQVSAAVDFLMHAPQVTGMGDQSPDPMQQYSGKMDAHEDSGNDY